MKKLLCVFLTAILLLGNTVFATSTPKAQYTDATITAKGFDAAVLLDANRTTYTAAKDGEVTVSRKDGVAQLYIEFDRIPAAWSAHDPASGKTVACGQNGFLHEYVDVKALFGNTPKTLVLQFEKETSIADVYAFSAGALPDFVQRWDAPLDKADILLLSSHSDDEQLFFAGMLPYYAVERGLQVQVAYVVQHFEANGVKEHRRPHEQLDGLWTVGVRHYPVMSDFPDLYAESKDRETAFAQAERVFENAGVTYDDFKAYITTCLRRFKPLVVVSHDVNGEYGHGTHVLAAAALTEAIQAAPKAKEYPESAKTYGTWQVEKTYLHLYEKNKITMDWDTPYESLGGKTPFEVTQDGFGCHKSQHWTWFYGWIYGKGTPIKKAADIKSYSPCEYGLYQTTVGKDKKGGDFMENVTSYEERRQQALEELQAQQAQKTTTAKPATTAPKEVPAAGDWLPVVLIALAVVVIIVLILVICKVSKRNCKHSRRGNH